MMYCDAFLLAKNSNALFFGAKLVRAVNACNVVNGGFEKDTQLPAIGYKYMTPTGWGGKGTIVIKSRNKPWGSLASYSGKNYLGIQTQGSFLQQTLTDLVPGQYYAIKFAAAQRPGTAMLAHDTHRDASTYTGAYAR